jgi:hypothetical protein
MLGAPSYIWYLAAFTFELLGLFIRWSVSATYGVIKSTDTPNKFSWFYWWNHNAKKEVWALMRAVVIAFVFLRFSTEWFNTAPSLAFACSIGLAIDLFIYIAKQKTQAQNINTLK